MLEDKHVLVLEDEPIIGFALEDMLLSMGCPTVLMATRLAEAREIIGARRVDAAILDVNIHGERSYPVADLLAACKLPYIFASGYGDTEHPQQHRSVPTITKPYSSNEIRTALRSALDAALNQ